VKREGRSDIKRIADLDSALMEFVDSFGEYNRAVKMIMTAASLV